MDIDFGLKLDVGLPPGAPNSMSFSFSNEESEEQSKEMSSSVDATLEMPENSQPPGSKYFNCYAFIWPFSISKVSLLQFLRDPRYEIQISNPFFAHFLNPPPISVNILRRESEQKIPFRSVVEKTYQDGSVGYTVIKGVYNSVTTSEILVNFSPIEFLNAESRYEDSPGLMFKQSGHQKTWFNLGSGDQYMPPDKKQPVGIWGPSETVDAGFCSLGDVVTQAGVGIQGRVRLLISLLISTNRPCVPSGLCRLVSVNHGRKHPTSPDCLRGRLVEIKKYSASDVPGLNMRTYTV